MRYSANSHDTGYFLINQLVDELADVCGEENKSKVEARLSAVLSLYDIQPRKPAAGHPDLIDHVEQYLAAVKLEGFSGYTTEGYERHLRLFTENIVKPVEEITTQDIRAYLAGFDQLKPSSRATKIWIVKAFFTWLVEEEVLEANPMRKIKPPKLEKSLPKALSIEELELLREFCRTKRDRAMIEVFYSSGARLDEVQQTNKSDVNWQENTLRVTGKGSKQRDVFLSVRARYHLQRYLSTRDDDCEALFVTERKPYRRLGRRAFQKTFKQIAERAGLEKSFHPHVMRHTFATLTLNNGAEMSVIQEMLGHASPTSTQIYAQVTDQRRKETHKKHLIQ